jgi:predicted lipid-binding transport protein (Tim44 family)
MPVIQKAEIPDLVAKLTKGEIDFNDPNSQQTLNAMKGMGTTPTNNAPAQPAAPVANPAPTNAGAPAGTPPAQNASTFHPGLNMSEQLLVLSGVLTIEQAENNLNKRNRR